MQEQSYQEQAQALYRPQNEQGYTSNPESKLRGMGNRARQAKRAKSKPKKTNYLDENIFVRPSKARAGEGNAKAAAPADLPESIVISFMGKDKKP